MEFEWVVEGRTSRSGSGRIDEKIYLHIAIHRMVQCENIPSFSLASGFVSGKVQVALGLRLNQQSDDWHAPPARFCRAR